MSKKKKINEELKELSPFLAKLKENEASQLPSSTYFDQMQSQVLSELGLDIKEEIAVEAQEPSSATNWLNEWIMYLFQPRLAMAVTALAVLIAVVIWTQYGQRASEQYIADEAILEYLEDNIEDIDLSTIADYSTLDQTQPLVPDVDDQSLEDYLENSVEDLDIEQLF